MPSGHKLEEIMAELLVGRFQGNFVAFYIIVPVILSAVILFHWIKGMHVRQIGANSKTESLSMHSPRQSCGVRLYTMRRNYCCLSIESL